MYKTPSTEKEESLMCYIDRLEWRADSAFFNGLWPLMTGITYVVLGVLGSFKTEGGFNPTCIMFFVIAIMFFLFSKRRFSKITPLRIERRDLLNKYFKDSNDTQ